jgi:GGDEF domain-containing protein
MGGEEFLVMLRGKGGPARMAERPPRVIATQPVLLETGERPVTMSGGWTHAARGEAAKSVIARADQGPYAAKRSGRHRVQRMDDPSTPAGDAQPA